VSTFILGVRISIRVRCIIILIPMYILALLKMPVKSISATGHF